MIDYEKLGVFYLGKEYDQKEKKLSENFILYDSKDLTTHAMCVGMTGSGKTGLCIGLLEEAAIDKIPALIIDPKGDLSNLMLTFPELRADDFKDWVTEEESARKGITLDELASKKANDWKEGLAKWNQEPGRIKKLMDSVTTEIYTPASDAGKQISVLSSLAAPDEKILKDEFSLRENILGVTSALLNLIGIGSDPIKSKETILISNVIEHYWKNRKNLSLEELINAISNPPMKKVGVLDLEAFYPSKERFELAMKINNLLASPGFTAWMQGEPLDVQNLLYTADGKPKHSIFSIAHLSDRERMFFVTMLLNSTINWMRTQSGTTSLRAILYMDEIFGYFPPTANPPSKTPMMTLLKQARAFGVGVVLATQNPVDLDYKGLSNIGTWFIGRLQTEQDKNRIMDGLQTISKSGGAAMSSKDLEKMISNLDSRVFLMNNVHEDEPVVFHTRWVMSFLSGPLTRVQISKLMKDKISLPPETLSSQVETMKAGSVSSQPLIPNEIEQVFIPLRSSKPSTDSKLMYRPFLLGKSTVHFSSPKYKIEQKLEENIFFPIADSTEMIDWNNSETFEVYSEDFLSKKENEEAVFSNLPEGITNPKNFQSLAKDYENHLYRGTSLNIFIDKLSGNNSELDESERDFRIRITHSLRELRDVEIEKIRKKYESKVNSFEEKIRRAEQQHKIQSVQYQQQKLDAAISLGATVLGALFGRKSTKGTIGRVGTTISKTSRTMREKQDVENAEENIDSFNQQIAELNKELESEIALISAKYDSDKIEFEEIQIRPKKSDIDVKSVSLAWLPYWRDKEGKNLTKGF
ncbi:MAG: ATP-binding protein [Bacteroidetes bacterium]|nr:ATP-binding protein [Bacteroidota bacterium]